MEHTTPPASDAEPTNADASIPPRMSASRWFRSQLRRRAWDFVTGGLLGLALMQFSSGLQGDAMLVCGLCNLVIGLSPVRRVVPFLAAVCVFTLLIIGYTPITARLLSGLERVDAPRPAPAVVVLSSVMHEDGTFSAVAQARAVEGYELLRQGFSDNLVLTDSRAPAVSWVPAVRNQVHQLGFDFQIHDVGPVWSTHDEAIAVAGLARQKGWSSVILVTHPWHMRRAALTFEQAGLKVICVPCNEGRVDLAKLQHAPDRYAVFSYWLHESTGTIYYKLRGWIP